jgi:hypothetical protein
MLKTIKILLVFLCSAVVLGKNTDDNYKLVYPKYIPQNSSFEISLVTNNRFHSAGKLELYVIPDERVNLNKIEFKSIYETRKLSFSSVYLDVISSNAYKTELDLSDSTIFPDAFFQLVFTFKSGNAPGANVKFYGIYKSKDKILGYLASSPETENTINTNLSFFRSQKSAGRAVQVTKQSSLEVVPVELNVQNLLAEFWVKLNDPYLTILKIYNLKDPDISLNLGTNEFQMLSVNSQHHIEYLAPFFISKKAWYHIAVHYSKSKGKMYFYCNGMMFAKYNADNFNSADDIAFKFEVEEQGKSCQIDLLRFIDFNNSIEMSAANRSFLNFKADSSVVLAQLKFDQSDELNPGNYFKITGNNLQYIKSEAPIIARAPELNIVLLNSAYELEWNGGDYKQAVTYILEKSVNSSSYTPVFTIEADNSSEKSYSYLDKNDKSSDILFYRIKQVNEDGSVVYSSQVKIGQGETESFTLKQNYPNPFNPKTSIDIELLEDTDIEVTIYNLEGEEITKLFKGFLSQGVHKFEFNAKELPSGVYIYKVATPGFSQSKKMILTK